MYKIQTVLKNSRVWYEIYNVEDKEVIVSTKSYKRAVGLEELLNNKKIKAESFTKC